MSTSINAIDNKSVRAEVPSANKVVTQAKVAASAKPELPAQALHSTKTDAPVKAAPPSSIVALGKKTEPSDLYNAAGVSSVAAVGAKASAPKSEGFVAGDGPVVVDIKASDSGYDNKIYYSTDNFATKTLVGIDNQVGSVNIGTFKPGTKIDFAIDNGQGQLFKAGGAALNADNFDHAKVTKTADGVNIGFEDLYGGGDRDFNDAIIQVRNTPAPPKDNRSGLGDGTNPGQGAGRGNSPNVGTSNPGGAVKSGTPPAPPVVPQPVILPPPVVTKPAAAPVTAQKDNRSGLGDGTNPGKGDGTVKATNQGTNNPGAIATSTNSTTTTQAVNSVKTATAPVAAKSTTVASSTVVAKSDTTPLTTKPVAVTTPAKTLPTTTESAQSKDKAGVTRGSTSSVSASTTSGTAKVATTVSPAPRSIVDSTIVKTK